MQLYYDPISKMFTLDTSDDMVFLGPINFAIGKLRHEYGLTVSQAREAVLQAVFKNGEAVSLDTVKRMAHMIKKAS